MCSSLCIAILSLVNVRCKHNDSDQSIACNRGKATVNLWANKEERTREGSRLKKWKS
jgi:hypothetical protein